MTSLNTCQARQAADLLDDRSIPESVSVLMGDLNAKPGEPTIEVLTSRGYVDTFLEAGNAECDSATGVGCTGGRQDADLSDLTNPNSRQSERIDYVFLTTKRDCPVADTSGLFAAEPASTAARRTGLRVRPHRRAGEDLVRDDRRRPCCGASRVVTIDDHDHERATEIDAATAAAITETFETVFNAGSDVETRLSRCRTPSSSASRSSPDSRIRRRRRSSIRCGSGSTRCSRSTTTTSTSCIRSCSTRPRSSATSLARPSAQDGRWLVSRRLVLPGRDPRPEHRARALP